MSCANRRFQAAAAGHKQSSYEERSPNSSECCMLARLDRCCLQIVISAGREFPKSKRLLRHADFQRVYQTGRRQFTGNMTVFFLRRAPGTKGAVTSDSLRVGFTVGKVLGGSVERNRIRRRMREAVRTSWPSVQAPVDIVFNPRRSVLELPFAQVAGEVARGLQVAVQRAREAQFDRTATKAERK